MMPHPRKSQWFAIFLLTAAAIFQGACSPSAAGKNASGMNVLVITLDTTRADAVGLYNGRKDATPNIDGLGREGVFFRDCQTPAPLTMPAHCTIFTGRYPIAHLVRNNGTYVLPENEMTLAEMLKEKGYATSAVIASFTVASKFGLKQGFDDYDEDFESGSTYQNFNTELSADRIYAKFVKWLDRRPEKSFFSWLHFYDAHFPYVDHPGAGGKGKAATNRARYDGEVAYVDHYVGLVVEALKARGLYENTLIVLVGDHGEGFGEHKEFGHGIFCYGESLHVPLIIHNPKLIPAGRVLDDRVCLIDVMPTILEALRIRVPDDVQGASLLKLIRGGGRKTGEPVYFESLFGQEENNWAPITGLMDGKYKFISLPLPELYDLEQDAGETRNLAESMSDKARDMDKRLMDLVAGSGSTKSPERRTLSEADVKKLTALGYVSAFSAKAKQRIDPKTAIGIYAAAAEMDAVLAGGNFAEAEKRLASIQAAQPGFELPEIYNVSYLIKKHKGDRAGALEVLKKAMASFPAKESFRVYYINELIAGRDWSAAEETCRGFLDENDRLTSVRILLGDVEMNRERYEEAGGDYRKAMELEPGNGMIGVKYAGALAARGDLPGAGAVLQVLGSQPNVVKTGDYGKAASDLGLKLFFSGEKDKGLEWLRKACASAPDDPVGPINLGVAYFNDRRYDLALESYRKALAIDANSASAYCNIGALYLNRFTEENDPSLLEKAQESMERAVKLAPDFAAAYTGRGSVNLAWGELKKALKDYEQALRLDPDQGDAYVNSALALQLLGRYGEALDLLDRYKARLYDRIPPAQRAETDRLYEQIKAMKGRG